MKIEIKIDENCSEPRVVVVTDAYVSRRYVSGIKKMLGL